MKKDGTFMPAYFYSFNTHQLLGMGIFLMTLALSNLASANPDPQSVPLSEEDFFAEVPIVLTATRLSQPVNEAPAAMTILDREMIAASGAREVADVFRLVPGFQVQHENGHTPIVTYHGMSDQYSRWLQVLVDGRSIYTPSIGGVEWSHVPLVLEEIERIEITRGPNAASFGSNAFAATINIITRHASETTGIFASYTTGDPNNITDGLLRYGNSTGNFDYRMTLGYESDDGFSGRHDLKRVHLGRLRADYRSNAHDTWLFQTGFNKGPRGLDYGDPKEYPERTREKEVDYHFEQVRWTHALSNNEEIHIQYFHNHHKVDETDEYDLTADEAESIFGIPPSAYTSPIHLALFNSITTDRHDVEIQHTVIPNKDWRLAWGGSARQDRFYAPGLISSDTTDAIDLMRIFANSEWHITKDATLDAGVMWEKSELTGNSSSPRLALLHRLGNHSTLRAVASKATRIPTMIEYDGEITYHFTGTLLPSPVLIPLLKSQDGLNYETIKSREVGLNSQFALLDLSTDIKLYRDHIENTIYFDDTSGFLIPSNGESVTINGLEFQADFKPAHGKRIFFGYALTKIDSDDINAKYTASAPLRTYSLLLSQRFRNEINTSLAFYRSLESEGLGDGNPLPAQNKLDFRISFPFKEKFIRGEATFVAQNISGEYIDWRNDDIASRAHYVTVSVQID